MALCNIQGAIIGLGPSLMDARAHFGALAAYNAWANGRLYADAAELAPGDLLLSTGIYFESLQSTLVHILKVDRAWLHLLEGGAMAELPSIPDFKSLDELRQARQAADESLARWIEALPPEGFDAPFTFTSGLGKWKGLSYATTHAGVLTHLFNHQTHHRGQAHAALTRLGVAEPRALDIIVKGLLDA